MSLISVLVAVAILGILAAALAAIFGNMSDLLVRSAITTETQGMTRLVESILSQPNVCANAMRANGAVGGPPNVSWNFPTTAPYPTPPSQSVNINHLEINPTANEAAPPVPAPAPIIAVQVAKWINPSLKLQSMYLRQPDPTKGEGNPSISTYLKNGISYPTTNAKLVLVYSMPSTLVGGHLREQDIDLTVSVDPTNGYAVTYCYGGQNIQSLNIDCHANLSGPDCPGAGPPSTILPPCYATYFVQGFSTAGQPICSCRIICGQTNVSVGTVKGVGTKKGTATGTGTGGDDSGAGPSGTSGGGAGAGAGGGGN